MSTDRTIILTLAIVLPALVQAGCQTQRSYATPQAAVSALSTALHSQEQNAAREVFGPRIAELRSGDPIQDGQDREAFARALDTRHEIRLDSEDSATLLVGEDAWPFAVPLVRDGSTWKFDTEAGIQELQMRRIGRNELKTIQACRTLVDAQKEYFAEDRDGDGALEYARKLMSSPGQRDGLYWDAGPGGLDPSPIGPALAQAASRTDAGGKRLPFYGYRYKLLTRQSAAAPGGARLYEVGGNLAAGWAALAYPDEYAVSGVMSFLVSGDGEVLERDLGPETESVAESMSEYDPTPEWSRVGE